MQIDAIGSGPLLGICFNPLSLQDNWFEMTLNLMDASEGCMGWRRWGSVSRDRLRRKQSESMLRFIKMLIIRRKALVNIKEAASRSLS